MAASPPLPDDFASLCREHFGLEDLPPEGPFVPTERLLELARLLKDRLGYRLFVTCAATHFPEEGDRPEHFTVVWRVRRPVPGAPMAAFRVRLAPGESCPSLVSVWAGADWQEREQYDLVGVTFEGHPDPRRIMLPEDWEGHPLRRDYPIDTRHFPWR